jgi:hypothetical protein
MLLPIPLGRKAVKNYPQKHYRTTGAKAIRKDHECN